MIDFMSKGEVQFLLDVSKKYKNILDKIFEDLSDELTAIDSAEIDIISSYYKGKVPERFSGKTIEQINEIFEFRRVDIIYRQIKSSDKITSYLMETLEKLHSEYIALDMQLGFCYPLNANNLLKNKKRIDENIVEMEIFLSDKKSKK